MAAVLLFAALQIGQSTQDAQSAEQVQSLAQLGVKVSALAHELQTERGRASTFLDASGGADDASFKAAATSTDSAITNYQDEKARLSSGQADVVNTALARVDDQLGKLTSLRESVKVTAISEAAANFRYTTLITDLLDIDSAIADATNDRGVADQVRATAAFSRLKEFASQEQTILFEVLAQKHFAPGQYRDFINSLAHQEDALNQFAAAATPDQRQLMDDTLTRKLVKDATALELDAVRGERLADLRIEPAAWFAAMGQKLTLLRQVETQLGRDVVTAAGKVRDDALRRALINIGLVLLTLIIAVTISLVVARSMVRPLTRLRGSALEVANHSLPDLVRRLREDEESPPDTASLRAGSTHNRIDLPAIDPVEIHSNDEIGQVARAFNAVQLEAVRVATEQAQLRRSVSTMFVNLSRRSQLLVDRLIRLIDNLEQGEQDPDRLSDLFKLDHLATRMRRNDENLLVLAGADAGRRWNQPASLVDVLRAATAEVEQYTRVRLGTVDETIEVAARAVNDMVHLVAELLENATSFSSPRTDVVINARRSGEEAIIEIEDQGIGMAKEQMEELNDRLARPPVFDVSVSRMMGLFVVGRLATRHHVQVHLKSANSGGTMAVVALSPEVLTPSQFGRPGLGADVPPIVAQRVESERMDTGLLESGRGDAARGELASNAENGRPIPGDQFRSEPFRPEPPRQDPFRPEPSRPEPSRADAGLDSETTRIEPVRAQSSGLKEESQRIPTIDSTVIPPANLPALPAPGRPVPQQPQQPVSPAAAGSPADTGQIRAVTPPPAARAPLAPSATESATGQFVQLGPIDEPSGKSGLGVSSAAAAMAVLRSAQAPPPVPPSIQPPPPVPPVPVQQQPAVPFDRPNGSARELLSGPADPASMDATIEMPLPIFDAIESEWFRSAPRPTPLLGNDFAGPPAPPVAPVQPVAQPVAPVVSQPVSQPVRPAPAPQPAAARVSTPAEKAATAPGLPIRTPGKVTDSGAPVGDLGGPHAPSRAQETAAAAASAPVRPAPERPAPAPVERPVSSDPLAGPPVPGSPLSSGSLSGRPVPATEPPTGQRPAAQYPDRPAAQNGTPSGVTFHPPVSAVPTSSPAATAPLSAEPGSSKWVSPADAGWKAAQAAAEAKPEATTTGGLPKRVPMAHFVPGRVDNQQKKTPKSTAHRSPDAVRGVLSSYRHGLEQGRQATQSKHSVATENDEQEEM